MVFSRHNLLTRVAGSDKWIIANLLSAEADLLEPEVGERLSRGEVTDEAALKAKGYLVDPDDEARRYQAAFQKFRAEQDSDEVQLFYVPSYACNFGCSYCFQDEYAPTKTLEADPVLDAFFAYVDDHFGARRKYVTLFGGEPLLETPAHRRTLERLLEGTKARGIDLAIVTNGYHLDAFVPLLATGRIREVQVTLDGPRAVHDQRRMLKGGAPTFDRIVAGIDACLAANLRVNLRTVLDKENIGAYAELAHFAIDKGWTEHPRFKTQIGRNYELHHCQVQNQRLYTRLSLYEDLRTIVQADPEVLRFYKPAFSVAKFLFENGQLPEPLFDACPATKTEWAFDSTGRIYPCTANVGKAGEELGMFYPVRSLKQGVVAEWKARSVAAMPGCQSCSNQLACGGGCGAVSKNQAGSVAAPDCRPVKELISLGVAVYGQDALR